MDGNLVFQLLQNYVQFVDIVTSRGAVRGDEMLNVGMLRQRTIEILNQAQAEAEAAAGAAANDGTEAGDGVAGE
jgi:hypothetical protein